jgi:hypothetical protein
MQHGGGFGTIKSLATKMQQSLGVSQLNLFALNNVFFLIVIILFFSFYPLSFFLFWFFFGH